MQVTEQVFLVHKEIARVYVAIVLDDEVFSALTTHMADGVAVIDEFTHDAVEQSDGNPTDILFYPSVKKRAEKIAPLAAGNREIKRLPIRVEFDAGNILMIDPPVVTQIVVDLSRSFYVHLADQNENIKRDSMRFEATYAANHIRV